MLRAYLVDMTVLRDYSRALLGLGFFVAVCVSLGMQTSVMAPGLLAMMYLLLGVSGTNSFDDLNGWERLRLTMPLSRRDVVLARYGAIATLGLGGLALGLAAAVALGAVALFIPLLGELSSALALSGDALLGMCLSAGALFAVGSLCAAVEVPLFFRFGNTRATQYLPLVPLFVLLCPIIVLGGSGMIDESTLTVEGLAGALSLVWSPAGAAGCLIGLLALSAGSLALSAALSLKLYETREF